jgi:hypothetical protein
MSNAAYHAADGLNNSTLSSLAKSPAHCYALHQAPGRPQRIATPAMMGGTLAHCAILEPHELAARYAVRPAVLDLRTKAGKEWVDCIPAGVDVITEDQRDNAEKQRAAVFNVSELAELLDNGAPELSAFWTDPATGILCKCRPDWMSPAGDGSVILLDVKTTTDADPKAFAKTVLQYGYHRQAAWYSNGYERATGHQVLAFVFAVVTNSYPFLASACVLDEQFLALGADDCRELLDEYADCKQSGYWPAFTGMNVVPAPAWALPSQELDVSYV